jgi:hypothetical protein
VITRIRPLKALAVHIGADVLDGPEFTGWARPLSCRDTVDRLARMCRAAGLHCQYRLLGSAATLTRVRNLLAWAATVGDQGLLVLSFSGHSSRPVAGTEGGWCLRDGVLAHTETAALLRALPRSAHLVVVAETCYAAAFADAFAELAPATVLVAACAAYQSTLNYPVSRFVTELAQLVPGAAGTAPARHGYLRLRHALRRDTPDVERPDILANRPQALRHRPFQRPRSPIDRTGDGRVVPRALRQVRGVRQMPATGLVGSPPT